MAKGRRADEFYDNLKVGDAAVHVFAGEDLPTTITKITPTQFVTGRGRFHRLRGQNYQCGDALDGAGILVAPREPNT